MRGDRRQWGVDLVRHACEQLTRSGEAVLFFGALPQHARHLVEMPREGSDFVVCGNGHFRHEIPLCHASQRHIELAQRPPHAAPDPRDHEGRAQGAQREPKDDIAQRLAGGGLQRPLPREQVVARDDGGARTEQHVHGRRPGIDARRQQQEQELHPETRGGARCARHRRC